MHKDNSQTPEYYFDEGCYITEWWNEMPDPEVSVARARLPAGQRTRPHSLSNTQERYLVLQGEGLLFIGDQPGQVLRCNDAALIPAGEVQSIVATGDQDLVFLAICTPRFEQHNYRALD